MADLAQTTAGIVREQDNIKRQFAGTQEVANYFQFFNEETVTNHIGTIIDIGSYNSTSNVFTQGSQLVNQTVNREFMDTGKRSIVDWFRNIVTGSPTQFMWGTGSIALTSTLTGLQTPTYVQPVGSYVRETFKTGSFMMVMSTGSAAGSTFSEIGIFAAGSIDYGVNIPAGGSYAINPGSMTGSVAHISAYALGMGSSFSIEFWFRVNTGALGNYGTFVRKNSSDSNGWQIRTNSTLGSIDVKLAANENSTAYAYTFGDDHHFALVYSGTTAGEGSGFCYMDGTLKSPNIAIAAGYNQTTDLILIGGSAIGAGLSPFKGIVDEVRYSSGLRYTANFTPNRANRFTNDVNTMGLWHLEESGAGTFTDSSSNNNTGSMNNLTGWINGIVSGTAAVPAVTSFFGSPFIIDQFSAITKTSTSGLRATITFGVGS